LRPGALSYPAGCAEAQRVVFLFGTGERNGFFRTSLDAQAASFAGLCIHQQRLAPPVGKALDLSSEAQRRSQFLRQGIDSEEPHRTNLHAFPFAFASIAVDHRNKGARCDGCSPRFPYVRVD